MNEWIIALVIVVSVIVLFYSGYKKPLTQKLRMVACVGGPFDLQKFNKLFVEANQVLTQGNTEALKKGIALLIEAMDFAGDVYAKDLVQAVQNLRCALTRHDRADTKGPWNWDMSGYGVLAWKNDLWERDRALGEAWPHIQTINDDLKKQGLGWKY